MPRDGYSALYTRAQSLFRDLSNGACRWCSLRNLLARLSRIDVLVIDDWAMAPLSEPERRDFWEICEDRYQARSTILTSQLPVSSWHAQIGDPTLADGILDRLVHNAHRIEMRGDSRCAKLLRAGKQPEKNEALPWDNEGLAPNGCQFGELWFHGRSRLFDRSKRKRLGLDLLFSGWSDTLPSGVHGVARKPIW